jgi:hypothetical protein
MSSPRTILETLPGVVVRRLATREGFFTAGRMFALLDRHSLLLRLPARAGADLHARSRGRMLLGVGLPVSHSWVEISIPGTDPEDLTRLASSAHEAVRLLSRRASRNRTGARRRRARSGPKD